MLRESGSIKSMKVKQWKNWVLFFVISQSMLNSCVYPCVLQLLVRKYSPQYCWAFLTLPCNVRSDCHNISNQSSKVKGIINMKSTITVFLQSNNLQKGCKGSISKNLCRCRKPTKYGSLTHKERTFTTWMCKSEQWCRNERLHCCSHLCGMSIAICVDASNLVCIALNWIV